jgi:hypothetical protein
MNSRRIVVLCELPEIPFRIGEGRQGTVILDVTGCRMKIVLDFREYRFQTTRAPLLGTISDGVCAALLLFFKSAKR